MTFAGAGLDINEVPKALFQLVLLKVLRSSGNLDRHYRLHDTVLSNQDRRRIRAYTK